MKRIVSIMLIMGVIISMITGCGGSTPNTNKEGSSSNTNKESSSIPGAAGNTAQPTINSNPASSSFIAEQSPDELITTDLSEEWAKHPLENGCQIADCYFYLGEPVEEALKTISSSKYKWKYDYNPDQKISRYLTTILFSYKDYSMQLNLMGIEGEKIKDSFIESCSISVVGKTHNDDSGIEKVYNQDLVELKEHNQSFDELASYIMERFKGTEYKLYEKQTSKGGELRLLYKTTYTVPLGKYYFLKEGEFVELDKLSAFNEIHITRNLKDKSLECECAFGGAYKAEKSMDDELKDLLKDTIYGPSEYAGFEEYKR